LPGSERPPASWSGWPGGKQFAFVLTHDVEGQSGLEKCRILMDLEIRHGFRSAFNFIPEGEYRVSREFRQEVVDSGCEVGVHDLQHDGRLYSSRGEFARKAVKINGYLKNWEASGFRSGFMLHNLEWLKDLNVLYEASTFDTDPFEPQPDGAGTIFPFWVPRHGHKNKEQETAGLGSGPGSASPDHRIRALSLSSPGFVELPYTLAQDSTLFLILGERGPDIWIQKLEWIARNRGMALMNVHPDYMRFEDEPASSGTFPVEIYLRFLQYVCERFAGSFWHDLPKAVAAFARGVFCPCGGQKLNCP
jgi:hypothetical protein